MMRISKLKKIGILFIGKALYFFFNLQIYSANLNLFKNCLITVKDLQNKYSTFTQIGCM